MSQDSRIISAQSKQYVIVEVEGQDDNGVINPTGLAVAFAFLPQDTVPTGATTWYAGSWFTVTQTGLDPIYKARVLIGPGGGVVTLTEGSWDVYVRVTHPTEVPIEKADTIYIY